MVFRLQGMLLQMQLMREKKLEMTMKAEMTMDRQMERQTIRMIPSNVRPSRIP